MMSMIEDVCRLKDKLLSRPYVFDGVNEQAREQNYKLMEALRKAGVIINVKYPNDVFGMFMQGSRIRGYHDVGSDADLLLVCPEGHSPENVKNVYDILEQSKSKFGVKDVKIHTSPEVFYTPIDPKNFLHQCDREPDILNSMLGFKLSSNPNLLMARLTAFRVIAQHPTYDWESVKKTYNDDYLGEMESVNPRIATRFSVPLIEVNEILNQKVWGERHKKFTLPSWKKLLARDEKKFEKLKKRNDYKGNDYIMMGVHEQVMSDLEAGL